MIAVSFFYWTRYERVNGKVDVSRLQTCHFDKRERTSMASAWPLNVSRAIELFELFRIRSPRNVHVVDADGQSLNSHGLELVPMLRTNEA